MTKEQFPLIKISGTPRERGLTHGKILKDKIRKTLDFYKRIFDLPDKQILETAELYEDIILKANPEYMEEIRGIAEGAELEYRWIIALNCRSEIITIVNQEISECTAIVVPESGLLAQNWDWAKELEELAVMMEITYDNGHRILMMTEPGIIGKIGLNSAGIGVTLNFLHAPGKLDGLPIHVMLRYLLDATSYEDAVSRVSKFSGGKAGNIILASPTKFTNFEFANTEIYETCSDTLEAQAFSHTNHFLNNEKLNSKRDALASSFARYKQSQFIIQQQNDQITTLEGIKSLLADQKNSELPICRPYVIDDEIGNVGTVCSLIMDLRTQTIHYTPGNPFTNDYRMIKLD